VKNRAWGKDYLEAFEDTSLMSVGNKEWRGDHRFEGLQVRRQRAIGKLRLKRGRGSANDPSLSSRRNSDIEDEMKG